MVSLVCGRENIAATRPWPSAPAISAAASTVRRQRRIRPVSGSSRAAIARAITGRRSAPSAAARIETEDSMKAASAGESRSGPPGSVGRSGP
jgi:hypothetical protein